MKLALLAALALVIGFGNTAHAGCVGASCTAGEQPTTTPQATYALAARIENALKDLEVANARAFKADQERIDALCAAANCAKPEPTKSPSGR